MAIIAMASPTLMWLPEHWVELNQQADTHNHKFELEWQQFSCKWCWMGLCGWYIQYISCIDSYIDWYHCWSDFYRICPLGPPVKVAHITLMHLGLLFKKWPWIMDLLMWLIGNLLALCKYSDISLCKYLAFVKFWSNFFFAHNIGKNGRDSEYNQYDAWCGHYW